ncbi:hypothetical protein EMIHUDRAFT_214934 [Emiliania huxleyi CCMP1516]|uniref:Uncharacterized protein n=2 Tax=Emiliania huxleyi TaxID=2903 RepID=A0A0D3IIN0_EMIH1|nr:hypothetical protein EMIHUDRAFT_214934 [Emiliania huxleyi CCMP1516]EOD11115.1 hypothetical protein EMIHUDRAFT_214934 [Emiliania huxleyi CCMP1516]|eukprot:XP_005763544.1 hypothetical protein EMIHUDRAFT_214934 [Emiliania huxleyi CCMP1516]
MYNIAWGTGAAAPSSRTAGSSSAHASLAPGSVDHEDEAMPSEQAGAASAHVPSDAAPVGPPDPIAQTPAYPPPTGPEHGREFRSDEDGDGPTGTEAEGVAYAETLAEAEGVAYAETLAEAKRAADERLRAALAACPLSGKVMRRGEHVEYLTTRVSPPERARAGWADDPPPSAYRRAAGAVILVRNPPDHAAAPTGGEAGSSSDHAEAEDGAELDGGVEPWAIAEMEEREAAQARHGQQQASGRRRNAGRRRRNTQDDGAFLRDLMAGAPEPPEGQHDATPFASLDAFPSSDESSDDGVRAPLVANASPARREAMSAFAATGLVAACLAPQPP